MRVDTLTPVLDAAPGESIIGRVRVVNDGADDAAFTVRVVGLDGHDVVLEVPGGPIGPGHSADVDVPLDVPAVLGVGQHAVALEVSSDRPDDRPALAQLTVSIDSLERVQMAPRPSTVRAGRNGRFTLDVINNETTTVDVVLGGEATDVAVVFDPPTVRLHPGERGWVRGRIRARQRWGGESIHHVLTLTARGRSSTTSTTMAYIQRPVVPGKARNAVAAFVVIAMFLGAIGGGLWWWSQRDTTEVAGRDVDGQLDPLDGTGTGTGTGGADADSGDGSGGGGAGDAGADAPPGPGAIPTFTVVTGTVSTSGGDPSGVNVAIAPIELGRAGDTDATIVGIAGRSRGPVKIWSARHSVRPSAVNAVRQTESVPAITTAAISTDGEGLWRFVDIPIRQNYELVFSKAGYDTQSFVVTPPADGSRVELDVELVAGTGQLSGTVVGPGGPLGGVDIVVTDGTLTFRTTSATEASGAGSVGSFAIEGLSTPAVYTLKASLRGYGTEVLQLPYAAGQERSGTVVSMRAGVGSISGRVTSAGEPRGGVTVVASNGDATFTTTTLTEGDVGTYSIPRLEVPGEYTVTATLPGYITQTRRVDLAGNASGVDYQLVPTTAGISGRVMSSEGYPLVGAGITVSLDDVGFRSATAASPVPGSFNIDDLPPGTYLVRIARFDHLPFSQQVTVGAGETVDLGTITLEFTARPPLPALGSIAVRVFDSEDRELTGSTVSVYALDARIGVDEPIATIADIAAEQSTFVFDNIAVGTYRVRVTRPIYRAVERRVSVGLGRENVQVRMLRLGQASGQIVTADGQPLRDYALNIYRREPSGIETLVESNVSVVAKDDQPDDDGKILWESKPDSLVAGTYRIEVINQPPGYEVTPNQVLDPTVTQTPAAMLFRVPADSEEPVVVGDIVADPLPLIGGRLFVPQYDAGTSATTMRALTAPEVAALPGLRVRLVCGDVTLTADVPPVRPSPVEPYVGFELPELANHFEFTPFAIQEANARGQCTLDVVAAGFIDTSVPLTALVRPTPTAPDPRQRTVNVALMEESNPLFGRVFWVDGTERIDLVGVDITSGAGTVTGATPRQGNNFGDTTSPRIDTGSSSTQSGAGGTWDFPAGTQLFGAAQYTFTLDNFAEGVLEVVLDDQSNPAATPVRQLRELGGLTFTERADKGVDVEMLAPDPGPLSGQVRIRTNRSEALFDRVGRRAVGPGPTVDPVPYEEPVDDPTAPTRPLLVPAVAAGTWTVDFALPPNHEFFGVPAEQLVTDPGGDPALTVHRVAHRVQPGTGATGFSTDIVELGLVDVDVTFTETPVPPDPTLPDGVTDDVTVHLRGTGGFDDQRDLVPAATTTASFDRLPVDPVDPVDTPAPYRLDVDRPGFDHAAASVVVTDRTNAGSVVTGPTTGSIDVEFDLRAGTDKLVTVRLPQYGTITGTVIGRGASDEVLQFADPLLEVDARRVDAGGTEITADNDRIVVGDPGDPASSFTLSGPPGTYEISVAHGYFEPAAVPLVDPNDPTSGPLDFVNSNLTRLELGSNPWVLAAKRGRLDLTALGSLDSGGARVVVADAKVVLQPQFGGPDIVARTNADGNVVIDDLLPGEYRLEVRRYSYTAAVVCPPVDPGDLFPEPCTPIPGSWDETTDLAYPVIAMLTIAPGITEDDLTTVVEVKLPSLTGTIDGTIFAVNSLYDSLDEPPDQNQVAAPMPIVSREYIPSAVEVVGGGTLPNTAGPSSVANPVQKTTFPTTGEAADLSRGFAFEKVPGGRHRLTFPVPDGYTLDGKGPPEHTAVTIDQDVDDTEDVGADTTMSVMYRALDVDLVVELDYPGGVEVDDPTVRLVDADGNEITQGVRTDGTTEFVFADLPPSTTAYRFEVDDVLAQPSPADLPIVFEVIPNGDGSALSTDEDYAGPVQRETVEMVGSGARVSGTALQQDSEADGTKNIRGPFGIVAESASGTQTVVYTRVETTPLPAGKFEAILPTAGTYTLFVVKDGFVSNRVTVEATLGVTVPLDRPLSVRAQGTATITVSNAPASTDLNPVTVVGFPANDPTAVFTGTRVSNTWTFALTPGVAYRFEVRRTGYYRVLIPSENTSVTPAIGQSLPAVTTRLVERVLAVPVAGPVENTAITVSLGLGGPPALSQTKSVGSSTAPLDFMFKSTDAIALPLTGGSDVTISATGYRQQVLTGTNALPNVTSDVVPVGATANSRTVSLSTVTLRPNVTKIGGTITGTDAVVSVSLSRDGGTPVTTMSTGSDLDDDDNPIAGTNIFEFESTAFATGSYVASVAILGDGAGASAAYDLTAQAPIGPAVTDLDIVFAPRNIEVDFTGLPQPGTTSVYDGASDAATKLTETSTATATFQRTERNLAGDYEVRAAGRLWRTITLTLSAADLGGVSKDAALTAFPAFSGTVVDADDELVGAASVKLYRGACDDVDPSGSALGTTIMTEDDEEDAGFGTFGGVTSTAGGRAGAYCIVASEGTRIGTLDVTTSGTVTDRAIIIQTPPPPPTTPET